MAYSYLLHFEPLAVDVEFIDQEGVQPLNDEEAECQRCSGLATYANPLAAEFVDFFNRNMIAEGEPRKLKEDDIDFWIESIKAFEFEKQESDPSVTKWIVKTNFQRMVITLKK